MRPTSHALIRLQRLYRFVLRKMRLADLGARFRTTAPPPTGPRWRSLDPLEPRILFSASPLGGEPSEDPNAAQPEAAVELTRAGEIGDPDRLAIEALDALANGSFGAGTIDQDARRELIIVDAQTPDHEALVGGLLTERGDGARLEVVVLDSERDGVEQISALLAGYTGLDAVHIISHGTDGAVQLGSTWLSHGDLDELAPQITGWSDALSDDADLLFYGCNLAASDEGQALVDALAGLSGADVAASTDLTGAERLGGDWDLEYHAGTIESSVAFSADALTNWVGTLEGDAPADTHAEYIASPLTFEENTGQTDETVDFFARGSGYSVFLTEGDAVIALDDGDGGYAFRLDLVGADPSATVSGSDALSSTSHYFVGSDTSAWESDVAHSGSVTYDNVWEGIDVRYYGNQRQLEYDFIVGAGADAGQIVLDFQGADSVSIDADGNLVIELDGHDRDVTFRAPYAYQDTDAGRVEVASAYSINDDGTVTFELGDYDTSRELIIDPILDYSTYLGGTGTDQAYAITVDGAGDVYVLGRTTTADFPATIGSFSGSSDAFVAKLSPDGNGNSDLVFATYVGGSGNDYAAGGIQLDGAGNIIILGSTESGDFVTTAGAYKTSLGGTSDAYVVKLNATGDTLLYSTLFGGDNGSESGNSLALDASGDVYITGQTLSSNLPTQNPYDNNFTGSSDTYVAKLTLAGGGSSDLLYATYLGGSTDYEFGTAIAVDSSGLIYVAGKTLSTDHPTTAGALDTTLGGSSDGYLTVLDTTQTGSSQLVYSTYIGGSGSDQVTAMYLDDATGYVYLAGTTSSADFQTTAGAFDTTYSASNDAFVMKIDPSGNGASDLLYSTYLGGTGNDWIYDLTVDAGGLVYVAGAGADGMPLADPVQGTFAGGNSDAYVATLDMAGGGASDLVFASYLGGADLDQARGIAVDGDGNIFLAGMTESGNLPTTSGAYSESNTGGAGTYEAFVAVLRQEGLTGGRAIWAESGSTTPETSTWNGSSFAAEAGTAAIGDWRTMQGAEAPTRDEVILVGVDNGGSIAGQMWNGSTWSALSINPMGSVSQDYWWSVDVAYESQSGDAIVTWADGADLKYSRWDGTSWTAPATIFTYGASLPRQLQLAASPGSDEMVLVVGDSNAAMTAFVWSGSSWGNSQALTTGAEESVSMNVAYEQQSGHALVAYGKSNDSDVYYRTWDGASWSAEGSVSAPAGETLDVNWIRIASDPTSDRIALGVITRGDGSNAHAWLNVWDGSSWGTSIEATTTMESNVNHPKLAVAFESESGDALAVYGDTSTQLKYRTWTAGGGWSAQQAGTSLGSLPNSMTLDADPNSDRIMLSVQDGASDLHFVRWNGSSWDTAITQETDTGEVKNQPFVFLWDRDAGNLAPQVDDQSFSVDENSANGSTVGTVAASDANAGDTFTYAITGGTGATAFAINGTTGEITVADSGQIDYESATSLTLIVEVTDDGSPGLSGTATITINLNDLNDVTPTVTPGQSFGVAETAVNGTSVGTVLATDPDTVGSLGSWTIVSGNGDGIFQIDANTGEITIADNTNLDYESAVSYILAVRVGDGSNTSPDQNVTINVTDVNDVTPTVTPGQSFGIGENAANGATVGTVLATDPDTVGSIGSWTIVSGNGDGIFQIDANTGAMTVADNTNLDYEITNSYVLGVQAGDGTNTSAVETVTINVTDVVALFTVNTTSDSGAGSLRQAVIDANTLDENATINFNIGGGGVQTIQLLSALPTITDSVTIDGTTQPGYAGTPLIVLDGSLAGAGVHGLHLAGGNSIVRGLVINQFSSDGIRMDTAGNNTLQGNYIGTDATGTLDLGNGGTGVYTVFTGSNTIGGAGAGEGNLISGNAGHGIRINMGSWNVIQGNRIGVDASGAAALGNTNNGIWLNGADNNTVGGTGAGEANVIGANAHGILVFSADSNVIQGNFIGTDSAGTVDLGNTYNGIAVLSGSADNAIGGTVAGAGNAIAFNQDAGVYVSNGVRTTILGNRIYDNVDLGIDLGTAGVTANDVGDIDTGANDLQNFPVITSAETSGTQIRLVGTLDSTASTTYRVEFFASAGTDPSGYGEAERYLGYADVTTDGSGTATFDVVLTTPVAVGEYVTATATDPAGNTSEFGLSVAVTQDVNDNAPVVDTGLSFGILEDAANGTSVGTVTASDYDLVGALAGWTIVSGNSDGIFQIDANTGEITIADNTNLDYESATSYILGIQVGDGTNTSATENVTVNVTDVNDVTPTVTPGQSFGIGENAANGATAGTVLATDPDTLGSLGSWTIVSGNGDGIFQIDANTGEITIADNTNLDYESATSYVLGVRAGDGTNTSATENVTINVTDVNDVTPTVTPGQSFGIGENAANGATVGTVLATDADTVGSLGSWTIVSGNGDGIFQIDANTGEITIADNTNLDYESATSYVIGVQAGDGTNTSATENVTINVSDANDVTPTVTPGQSFGIGENAANGATVGTVLATDPDTVGSIGSWTIVSGNGDGIFQIDANTGEVTIADSTNLDYESATSYVLGVRAGDGTNTSATENVTINVTDVNDVTPTVTPGQSFGIGENAANGATVGTVLATDPDTVGSLGNWAIVSGNGDGIFQIDANTGEITIADNANLDYESVTSYVLGVQVGDGTNTAVVEGVTINVTDVNDVTPTVTPGQSFGIGENAANGASVGTALATDPDTVGAIGSWAIVSGNGDGIFQIDANTGEITIADNTDLDYESATSYVLGVQAGDGTNTSATENVTINVTDVNDVTPTVTPGQSFGIGENAANGATVGTVLATDPDTVGSLGSWTIVSGNGDGIFQIDANTGEITIADNTNLDYESATSYVLGVQAGDGTNTSATENVTINVSDANDVTPTVTPGQSFGIGENAANGATVGTVLATDTDTVGSIGSWTIVSGNGDGIFQIDANTGEITIADNTNLDYESATSHVLGVQAGDGTNTSATENVTINVTDVNDVTPTVTPGQSFGVGENAANGTSVGTVLATDPDTVGSIGSWAIVSGNGDGIFQIDANTGEITIADNTNLDYESATSYVLGVQAGDGTNTSATENVTINVTDVNDVTPTVTPGQSFGVGEDAANGATVGTVLATDPDTVGSLGSWTIVSGNGDGIFQIDANTGEITIADDTNLDYESATSYVLGVRAGDGANTSATENVTINVTDVNDVTPTVTPGQSFGIGENAANGATVGTVLATDPDTVGSLGSWTIVSGNADGIFQIDANTGEITIADNTNLDYESATSYVLGIQAGDGTNTSATENVTINVTDVNDVTPTVTPGQSFGVAEDAANGASLGTVLATDPDTVGSLGNWTIVSGNADGIFQIDANTGEITIADNTNLDYESVTSYVLGVRAGDGTNTSAAENITINVTNTGEAPTTTGIADITVDEDSSTISIDLHGAFDDAEDDDASLDYAVVANTNAGLLDSAAFEDVSGTLKLDLASNVSGSATMSVRATDSDGQSVTATFFLMVRAVNDAPVVAAQGDIAVDEGQGAAITADDLRVTDVDDAAEAITFTLKGLPSTGALSVGGTILLDGDSFTQADIDAGRLTYHHGGGTTSRDSFRLTITDGSGAQANVTIGVSVTARPVLRIAAPPESSPGPDRTPKTETAAPERDGDAETTPDEVSEESEEAENEPDAGEDSVDAAGDAQTVVQSDAAATKVALHIGAESPATAASWTPSDGASFEAAERSDAAARPAWSAAPLAFAAPPLETLQALQRQVQESFRTDLIFGQMSSMGRELSDTLSGQTNTVKVAYGTAAGTTSALAIGYAVWALRGGSFLASALTLLPALPVLDPLPVLEESSRRSGKGQRPNNRTDKREDATERRIGRMLG